MNIEVVGPGRAGGALAIAADRAGHDIVAINGRDQTSIDTLAGLVDTAKGTPDLRIIAVSDAAISDVAHTFATKPPVATVHVSGAVSVDALADIAATGADVGSFHPLQTLPDQLRGAGKLQGSWIGVTADEPLRGVLHVFAASLGCIPFDIADSEKPLYHAGAAAAANFTVASLALSQRLFAQAGVPFDAAHPLVDAAIANAFAIGSEAALTGPIVRGDTATVGAQIDAVAETGDANLEIFKAMLRATATLAGASEEMREVIA
jgi:predicted short-subunit dehydrogenase-like oxidoreductase (DUF2520 family)